MNKRPHDMGGEPGGPIDTADHGMKFWEKQANALRSTLTAGKVLRLDELRRAAEDLGERYLQLEYFERTTEALLMLRLVDFKPLERIALPDIGELTTSGLTVLIGPRPMSRRW
ncbi:MAG TPA: hypothetical protein VEL04_01340 [Burkholderiales bacterium]|nr:hypothetical protein [Burkholderiales bacterium]